MKIATHNSVTGEQGSFWSEIIAPFAVCQTKTLEQQFKAGCRYFDIRAKRHNDQYYGAHGLWRTKYPLFYYLTILNYAAKVWAAGEPVYITMTYEGILKDNNDKEEFIFFCNSMKSTLHYLTFGPVCSKYKDNNLTVDWTYIFKDPSVRMPKTQQGFIPLDGHTWQTFLPIPWLWDRLCSRPHTFNNETFTFVDFL